MLLQLSRRRQTRRPLWWRAAEAIGRLCGRRWWPRYQSLVGVRPSPATDDGLRNAIASTATSCRRDATLTTRRKFRFPPRLPFPVIGRKSRDSSTSQDRRRPIRRRYDLDELPPALIYLLRRRVRLSAILRC